VKLKKKKRRKRNKCLEKKKSKQEHVQPELNIGLIGHVDHGKTTLTERLSGKWTDTHSEELKRGITIRLGYADATFYFDKKKKKYAASPFNGAKLLRKVSFIDAPGHESLMATMLSGAAIMDGALLLISANEKCPQPQTREHLMALEIIGIENIIVVQNKIDLVSKEEAINNHLEIKKFLKNTRFKDAPIIPISAQHNINIDMLIEAIEKYIPTPKRDKEIDPLMFIARSFDINKPGTKIDEINGGVLGGALKKGILKVGDEIEINPGYEIEEKNQKVWKILKTKIVSIVSGNETLEEAGPGGSLGVLTLLDPSIVKSDKLVGKIVGLPGKVPEVLNNLDLEVHLLERVVGSKEDLKVEPIKMNESFMLNVNSAATVGIVNTVSGEGFGCKLKLPIAAEKGSRVTISRMVGNRFRLIGYGIIK